MEKAIYLNVLLGIEFEPKGLRAPLPIDEVIGEAKEAIQAAARTATSKKAPDSITSYEIKRARPEAGPNPDRLYLGLLVYMEGEQDPPQNFNRLATAELQKLLEGILRQPMPGGWRGQIHLIEENTGAVDELDEEARASGQESDKRP